MGVAPTTVTRRLWVVLVLLAIILAVGCAEERRVVDAASSEQNAKEIASRSGTDSIHVQRIPRVGGNGACLRVVISAQEHRGCLRLPGVSVWRVADRTLLVARPSIELRNGRLLESDSSGFVVVPFKTYWGQLAESRFRGCVSAALFETVDKEFGAQVPLFMITGCSPSYGWAVPQYYETGDTSQALLFELQSGRWVLIADVDFHIRDRGQRCAVVPDRTPPAGGIKAREWCLLLGG
jgi:hypothetical protein